MLDASLCTAATSPQKKNWRRGPFFDLFLRGGGSCTQAIGWVKTRSQKTTAKLIQNNVYCFFITTFGLAIPAFFRFTNVTELM